MARSVAFSNKRAVRNIRCHSSLRSASRHRVQRLWRSVEHNSWVSSPTHVQSGGGDRQPARLTISSQSRVRSQISDSVTRREKYAVFLSRVSRGGPMMSRVTENTLWTCFELESTT